MKTRTNRTRRHLVAVLSIAGVLTAANATYHATHAGADPPRATVTAPAAPPAQPPAAQTPTVPAAVVADAARVGEAFATVADRVSPTVVSIAVEVVRPPQQMQIPGGFPFGLTPFGGEGDSPTMQGGGSGVIIGADGHILTNNHVVADATRIDVTLKDGRRFRARVIGTDPASDLAVIKIEARDLPAARFAASDRVRVGEWVIAIGSPFGLDYTVTAGVLSATGRAHLGANEIEDYIQTDASINPGNSGGPLVNLDGEVVGINTMIIGRGTGIGFAIPSEMAQMVSSQLIRTGTVERGWIGVGFQELTPELASHFGSQTGALVGNVVANGPSAQAGLEAGDVIVAIEGQPVQHANDLMRIVLRHPPRTQLAIDLVRNGRRQSVQVTTGVRPQAQRVGAGHPVAPRRSQVSPNLGLQLQPIPPELRQRMGYRGRGSVVVSGIVEGSPADRAGLRPGDVVLSADRGNADSPQQVTRAIADGRVLLLVERDDNTFFTALEREES